MTRQWPSDPRPRVVRRVVKADRLGKPKVVRDYRLKIQVERIVAGTDKPCAAERKCRFNWSGDRYMILQGTPFLRVTDPSRARRLGGRYIPDTQDYHLSCVPPNVEPMLRFFERIV